MKIAKIKLNGRALLVAVTTDDDYVITAGAFRNRYDANTAVNCLYTLAINMGLIDGEKPHNAPKMKLNELLEEMANDNGKVQ